LCDPLRQLEQMWVHDWLIVQLFDDLLGPRQCGFLEKIQNDPGDNTPVQRDQNASAGSDTIFEGFGDAVDKRIFNGRRDNDLRELWHYGHVHL
jgi:hypothetical protein